MLFRRSLLLVCLVSRKNELANLTLIGPQNTTNALRRRNISFISKQRYALIFDQWPFLYYRRIMRLDV